MIEGVSRKSRFEIFSETIFNQPHSNTRSEQIISNGPVSFSSFAHSSSNRVRGDKILVHRGPNCLNSAGSTLATMLLQPQSSSVSCLRNSPRTTNVRTVTPLTPNSSTATLCFEFNKGSQPSSFCTDSRFPFSGGLLTLCRSQTKPRLPPLSSFWTPCVALLSTLPRTPYTKH